MFKVSYRNTRTRCEIYSKLTINRTTLLLLLWYLYCQLWTYFTPCSTISIVKFEQANVGWEDVKGFKSRVRVTSFTCLDCEKELGNSGKSQDYLASRSTVKF